MIKYNKEFAILFSACFLLSFFLSGCATKQVSTEEMQTAVKGFDIPYKAKSSKALVYFIYRADKPMVYGNRLGLYYAKSTQEKYENATNTGSLLLDVVTLGLTKEKPLTEKTSIGELEPGQFRTIELDPGYYEFKRILLTPSNIIGEIEKVKQIKVEAGNLHFIELVGGSFYNRYSKSSVHNIYIKEEKDPLTAKYILYKNFKEAKE